MENLDCYSCQIKIERMDGQLKLVNQKQETYEKNQNKLETILNTIDTTLGELKEVIATSNGKKEGVEESKKNYRLIYGSLATAIILGAGSSIISLNSKVAVISEKVNTLTSTSNKSGK